MIASEAELKAAIRHVVILEAALQALHDQLKATNPELLAITCKAYMRRIESLEPEIANYLVGDSA
jgi:hypothetical protein